MDATKTDAVIFDLDGTLADTLADIGAAANHVLAELGCQTHGLDQLRRWVGWGVRHLVEQAMPDLSEALIQEAVLRFRARYAENLVVDTAPYPGVAELLDELVARGVPMAVLSNKPQAMTSRIMELVFGRWQFVEVVGRRSGVPHKPDPTSAIALLERLAVPAARCLFVGDTAVDMETARASGMTPIGVGWGFCDGAELLGAGAVTVLSEPRGLLERL